MNKKITIALVLLASVVVFVSYMQFTANGRDFKTAILSSEPLETYIGGACTCPPSGAETLQIVNLYQSKGESLEKVKHEAQIADCSQFGCAQAKEYRLYP